MTELKYRSEAEALRYVLRKIADFPYAGEQAAQQMQLMAQGALTLTATPALAQPTSLLREREELERIKNGIDTRLDDRLCEMKPNYDDSITGFNEAWDIVRKYLNDKLSRAAQESQ